MPRKVCIWAEAGGVGKTTMAYNVAAALSRLGNEVLAIDLDHQRATLTEWAGYGKYTDADLDVNILDCLVNDDHDLSEIIVDAGEFDLAPSHTDLARFDPTVAGDGAPIFKLRNEIEKLDNDYDYFITDAPASRGLLSDNALVAMQNLLVPMPMGHKGYQSTRGIEETVSALESGLETMPVDISLQILGIVPNRVGQKNIEDAARQQLEDEGTLFVPVEIGERGVLEDAWNAHMSIFEYAEDEEYGLREYEKDLIPQFTKLAQFITGEWNPYANESDEVDVREVTNTLEV